MVLKLLWLKLIKYIEKIKLNKINHKLYKINSTNLIESKFIPDKISKYIKTHLKYKYIINYKYNNYNINLEYYCKNKINTSIFTIIIKRIVFMMIISNTYKNLNIQIYDTPFKKTFNCCNYKKCGKLNHNNVNSGLSYLNNIVIFRKEEYLKLLIHELIHALDIDNKYETYKDNKKIFDLFSLNKENVLINESYVETWAIIINVFLVLYEKKKYTSINENNINLFKKYLKKELIHSLQQCSKLCIYYNINDFNKIYKGPNSIKYEDPVNTFSYHIVKTINLYNINNFTKNFTDSKFILKSQYNYKLYINFIIKYNKTIVPKINFILKNNKNKSLKSLTMSSIN